MIVYPQRYFITSGCGRNKYRLVAFDEALRDAGIADYNLIKISSILPAKCQQASVLELPKKGIGLLTAYGSISCNERGICIASAVAVAIPEDDHDVGIIMEYSGRCDAQYAENQVREMAVEAMKNRDRAYREILSSSKESVCDGKGYCSVISAISIW